MDRCHRRDGLKGAVRIVRNLDLASPGVDGAAPAPGFETLEVVVGGCDDRLAAEGGAGGVTAGSGRGAVGYMADETCSLDRGKRPFLLFVTAAEDPVLMIDGARLGRPRPSPASGSSMSVP